MKYQLIAIQPALSIPTDKILDLAKNWGKDIMNVISRDVLADEEGQSPLSLVQSIVDDKLLEATIEDNGEIVGCYKNALTKERVNIGVFPLESIEIINSHPDIELHIIRILINEKTRAIAALEAGMGIDTVYHSITSERREKSQYHFPKRQIVDIKGEEDVYKIFRIIEDFSLKKLDK